MSSWPNTTSTSDSERRAPRSGRSRATRPCGCTASRRHSARTRASSSSSSWCCGPEPTRCPWPGAMPVGRAELLVEAVGAGPRVRAPLLVSLSDQWAIANFEEIASLLRYFDRQDLVAKLHAASPATRATLWHEFFKATDPVPLTPENEALDEYFGRLGIANVRFQEAGVPGWLTDRGEVFITLGEPDDVFDLGSEVTASGARGVRWEYTALRLTLYFQDQTGFAQYRLTPASRAEYQRVLAQVRRSR